MAKAYSLDFRKKAIEKRALGFSVASVAKMFLVTETVIRNWEKRFKETGDYKIKTGYQKGHGHIITDLEAVRKIVDAKPEITQKELAKHFNTTRWTAGRALAKLGYSKKKDFGLRREK